MAREMIESGNLSFSRIPNSPEEAMDFLERYEAAEKEFSGLSPEIPTPNERREMREVGAELGLSPARYVGTADILHFPKESVKELMAFLNNPEMPRIFTRRESVGQFQFVNNADIPTLLGIGGLTHTTNPEALMRQGKAPEEKTLAIYIFPEKNGRIPAGNVLRAIASHELVHGNWPLIREYIEKHADEATLAVSRQIEQKGLPSYPLRQLAEDIKRVADAEAGKRAPLTIREKMEIRGRVDDLPTRTGINIGTRLSKETTAELIESYFIDKTQLVPITQEFLKNMLEYFREY